MENNMNNFYDKGVLMNGKLYQYILETSVYPRESEPLKELRTITANHPLAHMGAAPDASQFIALLLKLTNARKTIEIGVFTGYSLLLTALAIPDDGMIIAIDKNKSTYNIGLPIIKDAGVEQKINFIESDALPALTQLLENDENVGSFDFAFVDADKESNLKYHEKLLKLIKPGEIIAYDNTLWAGTVVMPEKLVPVDRREVKKNVMKFNKFLATDERVEISLVPLGDGITICRRII